MRDGPGWCACADLRLRPSDVPPFYGKPERYVCRRFPWRVVGSSGDARPTKDVKIPSPLAPSMKAKSRRLLDLKRRLQGPDPILGVGKNGGTADGQSFQEEGRRP